MAAGLLGGLDSVSEEPGHSDGFLTIVGRFSRLSGPRTSVQYYKLNRTPKKLLFMWVTSIGICHVRNLKRETLKIFVHFKATHVTINDKYPSQNSHSLSTLCSKITFHDKSSWFTWQLKTHTSTVSQGSCV